MKTSKGLQTDPSAVMLQESNDTSDSCGFLCCANASAVLSLQLRTQVGDTHRLEEGVRFECFIE